MIYLTLFIEFFLIGLFTFGGGYAMIPLVKDTVLKHEWLTESEFFEFIGVCESTPGPIAINMATYVGSTQGGILGAICATLGVVLPSFIIIVLVAMVLKKFIKNKYFQRFLSGIKPVILGLIFSTGLMLIFKAIGYNVSEDGSFGFNFDPQSLIILLTITITFVLYKVIFKKKMNTIFLIVISAGLGILVNVLFNL